MSGVRGVLEFYSVRIGRRGVRRGRALTAMRSSPRAARFLVLLGIAAVAGCASAPREPAAPTPAQPAPYVEPPPPPVNLQGFPPTYRLGFGDGCATGRGAEKKDPVRFASDGNYRVGWQDGLAQCRRP